MDPECQPNTDPVQELQDNFHEYKSLLTEQTAVYRKEGVLPKAAYSMAVEDIFQLSCFQDFKTFWDAFHVLALKRAHESPMIGKRKKKRIVRKEIISKNPKLKIAAEDPFIDEEMVAWLCTECVQLHPGEVGFITFSLYAKAQDARNMAPHMAKRLGWDGLQTSLDGATLYIKRTRG